MSRRQSRPVRLLTDLAGLVIFLVCVFPVYWMVTTSFLPRREIRAPNRPGTRSAEASTTTTGCSPVASS